MEKVCHFDTEQQRFFGEFHVKGVIATIFGNDRQVGFLLERLEGGFDTQHVLRAVGKSGDKVLVAQIYIDDLCREDDVCCLGIAYFESEGRNHAVETDFTGKTAEFVAVGEVFTVHFYIVFGNLSGNLFRIRRHVVIGVFGCVAFCEGGCCHAEDGNDRENNCFQFHCLILDLVVLFNCSHVGGASPGIRL